MHIHKGHMKQVSALNNICLVSDCIIAESVSTDIETEYESDSNNLSFSPLFCD